MDISAHHLSAAGAGTVTDDRLSEQLATVVATARRRAARGGDRDVDTAHLLHSLLESDSVVRAFLGGGGALTAKLLGYLAQRSIGYGLRWRDLVETTGAAGGGASGAGSLPGWSPAATAAMSRALDCARVRGAERAEGADVFAGLVADAECRAAEVLRTAGVDVRGLAAALGAGRTGRREAPAAVRGIRGDTPVGC